MVRIECDGLTKEFFSEEGPIVAVDSVDLDVEDGTFVTILGPSGCGKTTLLRMIAGLETPTEGSICFDGEEVTDWRVQDRQIGMIFQDIALFPYKTVRKNIEYGLKYMDADKDERERQARELAELLGIDDLLAKKPNQLSGGQRQRVALGRALIRDPKVFLLDEPMSDLDAELKVNLRTELKELHKEFRTTTFYVTHDQEEAMTLSEEVIVMNDGEVQQQSPPFELFTRPNSMFVARFVGSPNINFFDARVVDGGIDVPSFDRTIGVPSETLSIIERELDGHDPCVGIRPSALTVVDEPDEAYFEAEATLYEQLGDETILHATIDGDHDLQALVPPRLTPTAGEVLRFRFEPSDVHVFDRNTGEAIVHGMEPPDRVASVGKAE